MRTMDKKLKAVRKRLLTDFGFYAKAALKIRTKAGEIAPLKLNPAQKILQEAIDNQMESEGKDVLNLGIGNPNGMPSPMVIDELIKRSQQPDVHGYQSYAGIPELKQAINNATEDADLALAA